MKCAGLIHENRRYTWKSLLHNINCFFMEQEYSTALTFTNNNWYWHRLWLIPCHCFVTEMAAKLKYFREKCMDWQTNELTSIYPSNFVCGGIKTPKQQMLNSCHGYYGTQMRWNQVYVKQGTTDFITTNM